MKLFNIYKPVDSFNAIVPIKIVEKDGNKYLEWISISGNNCTLYTLNVRMLRYHSDEDWDRNYIDKTTEGAKRMVILHVMEGLKIIWLARNTVNYTGVT